MVNCPVCKNPKPFLPLIPAKTMKQLFQGHWVCGYCGSEVDWKGDLIKKNEKELKEYEDRLSKEEYIKERARLHAQKEHKKK